MDSKVVSRRIRHVIRPVLREAGFRRFTSRSAWRYDTWRIDVLNFESFSAHSADVLGCTTHSFRINLGCFLRQVPELGETEGIGDEPRPQQYECHFRGSLPKATRQTELDTDGIWYVDAAGRNLEEAVDDARDVVARLGLDWYDQFSEPQEVLRILLEGDLNMPDLWGFGRKGSSKRRYLTGYLALALQQNELAWEHLAPLLQMELYSRQHDRILQDLQELRS